MLTGSCNARAVDTIIFRNAVLRLVKLLVVFSIPQESEQTDDIMDAKLGLLFAK